MKPVATLALAAALWPTAAGAEPPAAEPFRIAGDTLDASECPLYRPPDPADHAALSAVPPDPSRVEVFCHCQWRADAPRDACRALTFWRVARGRHGDTRLDGLCFALAFTRAPAPAAPGRRQWEGVLYIDVQASPPQAAAVEDIVRRLVGESFLDLAVRRATVAVAVGDRSREAAIGAIAQVKAEGLRRADGSVETLPAPPAAPAAPVTYRARADAHVYNDGITRWEFAGRNAFYGGFEYAGEPVVPGRPPPPPPPKP